MAGNVLVLVDGYSSGSKLPKILKEHGWLCIHVSSGLAIPDFFRKTFNPDDYIAHIKYSDDIDTLVQSISSHEPMAVLPGAESGVILASEIAHALNLRGNLPADSVAYRDKYEMQERLKAAGLRSIDQYLAGDPEQLLVWAQGGEWPVVIKPRASSGSNAVIICRNEEQLRSAFKRVFCTTDNFGVSNTKVLAQRFIDGREYNVNGVSADSSHAILDIWQEDKIFVEGHGTIFDRSILLDPASSEAQSVAEYTKCVLDALGMRWGPHNTQIIVDTKGPVLVECAARLCGGLSREAVDHAIGVNVLDATANIVVNDGYVRALAGVEVANFTPLWQIALISGQEGLVKESYYKDLFSSLESITWPLKYPKVGDYVRRTVDLFSSPGTLCIAHSDLEVLYNDYLTIREWERDMRLMSIV